MLTLVSVVEMRALTALLMLSRIGTFHVTGASVFTRIQVLSVTINNCWKTMIEMTGEPVVESVGGELWGEGGARRQSNLVGAGEGEVGVQVGG